jgi:hypothetical protein
MLWRAVRGDIQKKKAKVRFVWLFGPRPPPPPPPFSKVRPENLKKIYCIFGLLGPCLGFWDQLVFFPIQIGNKKLRNGGGISKILSQWGGQSADGGGQTWDNCLNWAMFDANPNGGEKSLSPPPYGGEKTRTPIWGGKSLSPPPGVDILQVGTIVCPGPLGTIYFPANRNGTIVFPSGGTILFPTPLKGTISFPKYQKL